MFRQVGKGESGARRYANWWASCVSVSSISGGYGPRPDGVPDSYLENSSAVNATECDHITK
ncbi:hypothetical protein FA95DRAFT_1562741 [Auriscalpium vulgare]|uniref:Uncharacterized protein n=1 Tax=Auriscalpium vulgare TaxID=40419 RepID=A0ACB8RIW4_9AGAM|nr:hypothetical protein FA95DRAFT_1562741 [Auriscalpium vulgare]